MRLSPRIVIPIVSALLVAGVAGGVFYWQIHSSVRIIEAAFNALRFGNAPKETRKRSEAIDDLALQSEALLALRQGELFEFKGEWAKAEEKFQMSVDRGGGVAALRKLVSVQLQRREYDRARESIAALRREVNDEAETMLLEGLLELRSGHIGEASRIFGKEPGTPESEYGLGLIAIAQAQHEAARTHLTAVADGSEPSLRSKAQILLGAYSEFSLFADGQDTHLATLLSRSLAQVNECEIALPLLSRVVSVQDKYRDAWIVKGFCEFNSERYTDSLASLERAYAIDPEKPEIQYFLARTHSALGDPRNAVTFLQYAIVNGFVPESEARELLAQYALELGDVALALDQYRALSEKPDATIGSVEKFVLLAIRAPGHAQDAYDLAKSAVRKWPSDPLAFTLRAQAAAALGNTGQAEQDLKTALNLDPKFEKAVEALERLKHPPTPASH